MGFFDMLMNKVKWKNLININNRTLRAYTSVESVIFSSDGRILASGGADGTVTLWNIPNGNKIRKLQGHSWVPVDVENIALRQEYVAISPDGHTLASGERGGIVTFWDAISGNETRILKGHSGNDLISLAFSPDGHILASGDFYGTVTLWDMLSGNEIRTLKGDRFLVYSMAFSPDWRILALGERSGIVTLLDVTSGNEIGTMKGHSSSVQSVAFSPNGCVLASGDFNGILKFWDPVSGNEIQTLKGHPPVIKNGIIYGNGIISLAFNHDGSILASGSEDRTVKLWDVTSGNEIRTLKGHSFSVQSVAFSPDGRILASGSTDGTIRLWSV